MSEIGLVLSPMLPINLQTRVVVYTTPLEDNVESSLCLSKPEDCFAYGAASVLVNDVIATHVGSTQTDNGILGSSTRMKYNEMGLPIMKAYDADGKGVLDYDVSQYEVESLLSPFPLYLA